MAPNGRRESDALALAAETLRDSGFPLVQVKPNFSGVRPLDVLAWGTNEYGELVPQAVVEVVRSGRPEPRLPRLAQTQTELGTTEHYVFTHEGWFQAEHGLRTLKPVEKPREPRYSGGVISDVGLATELIVQELSALRAQERARYGPGVEVLSRVLDRENGMLGIRTATGQFLTTKTEILSKAFRGAIARFTRTSGMALGRHTTPPEAARAIAELLGNKLEGVILDPFCGLGEVLWATADRAETESREIQLLGSEILPEVTEIASVLAEVGPVHAHIELADAFSSDYASADAVVSAPILGLRLQTPHFLLNGDATVNGDLAAVDLCLRSLKPGGRAVMQVIPSIAHQQSAERYRKFLATQFRVAALIGCPSGAAAGTAAKTILMVIDRAESGETFVAQLGEDWEMQLRVGSPMLSAAREHLDQIESTDR